MGFRNLLIILMLFSFQSINLFATNKPKNSWCTFNVMVGGAPNLPTNKIDLLLTNAAGEPEYAGAFLKVSNQLSSPIRISSDQLATQRFEVASGRTRMIKILGIGQPFVPVQITCLLDSKTKNGSTTTPSKSNDLTDLARREEAAAVIVKREELARSNEAQRILKVNESVNEVVRYKEGLRFKDQNGYINRYATMPWWMKISMKQANDKIHSEIEYRLDGIPKLITPKNGESFSVWKRCLDCDGVGFVFCDQCNDWGLEECAGCQKTGEIGSGQFSMQCPGCGGIGFSICSECGGTHLVTCGKCDRSGFIKNS